MTADLYAASVQALSWDETISMAIAEGIEPTTTGGFYQVLKPRCAFLLEHRGSDLSTDLAALPTSVSITTSFAHGAPAAIMEKLGFTFAPGQTIRCMAMPPAATPPACPEGVSVRRLGSLDDSIGWDQRIQVESDLFGYPATGYVDRLRIALAHMLPQDAHWLALDATGKAIGYMTMRYTRGVAYLQGAGVLAAFRRRGITRHLLSLAIDDARAKGFDALVTTGWDDAADTTWHNLGFTKILGTLETWERPLVQG
ncbi:hypothetical protein ACHHYP_15152 [Achlya hypogyna]|uniref:N-acetyltransferase domain-containing protein n=1 Tax=Achlya hypogyna TaxID=1202772 RepID=A0A1V9YBI4_ACHHY|nr:hypothetical protein ACHHYP_15152 [Achlya hypogyna]